jgi:group I intron endonuclease
MWGKPKSKDQKQKIREANLGEKNPNFGKLQSEETKQRNREAHLGEKNYKSKRVYQYDLDGAFINSFGSTEEAGRHLEKYGANIRKCACGKQETAYGFKWSYVKY